jgi:hypothetical protein
MIPNTGLIDDKLEYRFIIWLHWKLSPIFLRSIRSRVNKVVNIDAFFLLAAVHKINTEQLRFPPSYHANQKLDSKT